MDAELMEESRNQDYYIPQCVEDKKPKKGRMFITLEEGIEFYKEYGRACGFDIRRASAKKSGETVIWRYLVCSREGEKITSFDVMDNEGDGVLNKRKRVSMRCGCPARLALKYNGLLGYVVQKFVEKHNHQLVPPQYKHYLKLNRQIDHVHQKFILDCAKANIGPTHSFKLLSEFLGGQEAVGCSLLDVRNFARDKKAFVEGSDAQMMLNELGRKKERNQAFTFHYEVDQEDKLKRLFWSDPISRRNYHMFSDVVAFDTTYSTNKYCMIFAPFTGKDNNGRPVTFAAGLLSGEDAESFSWLFEKFVECMGSAPSLIITDQDLGMKAAIERVLVGTRHRWCMWHIMLKVADKISKDLQANEEFKKELNHYVWSELIEPEAFEAGWAAIMMKYGLVDDDWFKSMFQARSYWVPAFFRDFPMSGLLRTTSISESENSFYKRYTRSRNNLLEFWMSFNHALDEQRHAFSHANYLDTSVIPTLQTKWPLEKQAAVMYSSNMMAAVQEEISSACNSCAMLDINKKELVVEYSVKDEFGCTFKVVYTIEEDVFACGCKLFLRKGILCRHIFLVFKNKEMKNIPEKYIIGRWRKVADVTPVHDTQITELERYVGVNENQQMMNKIMSSVYGIMQQLDGNMEKLSEFLTGVIDVGRCVTGQTSEAVVNDKKKAFEAFYGSGVPEEIQVHPPNVVKTKGSGSRLVSRKEKAIKMANKPKRRCAKCKEIGNHDARNCDKIKRIDKQ